MFYFRKCFVDHIFFTSVKMWAKISVTIRLRGLNFFSRLTFHCDYSLIQNESSNIIIHTKELKYKCSMNTGTKQTTECKCMGLLDGPGVIPSPPEMSPVETWWLEADSAVIGQNPYSWQLCEWWSQCWRKNLTVVHRLPFGTPYVSEALEYW